jgi:hypothetical protein
MFNAQILLAQQSINTTGSIEMPSLLNNLWTIAMDDSMYRTVSFLSMLIAAFTVGFWFLKVYNISTVEDLRASVKEVILPLMLVFLLFNNGKNMKDLTLATKGVVNSFNVPQHSVIDEEISLRAATDKLMNSYLEAATIKYQSSL